MEVIGVLILIAVCVAINVLERIANATEKREPRRDYPSDRGW